jgi:hypothetical protein
VTGHLFPMKGPMRSRSNLHLLADPHQPGPCLRPLASLQFSQEIK